MGILAIAFAVDVLISTFCIWMATKLSFVELEAKVIAVIVVCVSVVSLIPYIGWLAGIILFFYMLTKASGCDFVDAVWVILFTKLISFGVVISLNTLW